MVVNIDNIYEIENVCSCVKIIEIILNLKIPISEFLNGLSQSKHIKSLYDLRRFDKETSKHKFYVINTATS